MATGKLSIKNFNEEYLQFKFANQNLSDETERTFQHKQKHFYEIKFIKL